ncbi:hypothetical protein ACJRO7_033961 [Eucalyptus globulus]|uniref:Retrotransposon gag domain-containing protein n=1 Tax=Eucalyptus globulus TaxID=34317 RepID=A0ABD3J1N0_EUCGL
MREMMRQQARNQATTFTTAVAAIAQVAANAVPFVEPITAPPEVPPGNVAIGRPMHKLVEQFLKLNPPKFTEVGNPKATALWIQGLEKTFALLICIETEKVVLVTYQLEGIVSTWWRTTQGTVFLEGVVPKWNTFVEVFNNKYFFETAREMKMAEFQHLRQGSIIVDQYEANFTKLSQYAPELVENPMNRVRRFRDGLRPKLRSPLILLNLRNYNNLYERI